MAPLTTTNKDKTCEFIPGKLYYIRYKGFGIPLALHEKVVLCLDTVKQTSGWGKQFYKITVLVGGKMHDLLDFSYKIKKL